MITAIAQTLERGFNVMRLNSRMMLVGALAFIFPFIFFFVAQSFFSTAQDNINTTEKQRISIVHEALEIVLENSLDDIVGLQNAVSKFSNENTDISKLRVYESNSLNNDLLVLAAADPELVSQYDESAESSIAEIGFSEKLDFQLFELQLNGERTWQVFKRINIEDKTFYIFSEQNFAVLDSTMNYRKQQSYLGLSVILLFLLALSYWLHRQTDWQAKYEKIAITLKERDQFSNMIAHEFRTPLTAIKGYASFLQESDSVQDDEKRFANNIYVSAERLVVLVNDFLEVSRIQAGKITVNTTEFDLRDVLERVVEDLTPLAKDKHLELVFHDSSDHVMLNSDPDRMTQVMTNIISNAIKYTPDGKVEVVCAEIHGRVEVRVKDTGTGISAEDQKKLFSPFTRVGGVDAGTITGSGLGMWITRQLVEFLGGTIGVESIQDVGTHVVIKFAASRR